MAPITAAALSLDSAWSFTPKPYDVPHSSSGVTILDLFFQEAQSRPRAPAVCSAQDTLSYGQLDDYSTRLAYHLQSLGIERESLISCRQHKSVWAIVSFLAILKAGAAFVPVDPSYPQSRVEEIIEQSDAQLIIESGCETMHTPATTLRLGSDFIKSLPKKSSLNLRSISASQLAYVYFTSGSTGKPKGVMIEHRALSTSLLAHGGRMGMCTSSRVLQATSYTFDPSMTEIFATLIFGGCICIPSNHTELVDSINHLKVSISWPDNVNENL
jgi:non-ribosomal peptide synthetase component F